MFKRILIVATAFLSFKAINAQPPGNAVTVYHQGLAFMAKDQYPDAMISFFKAVTLYKKYDSAYLQMANINVRFSSFDTAMKFYKLALEANPKNVTALVNLATIYKNVKNEITSALECYLKAVAIDSANKEVLMLIAWCYNNLKDYDKAIPYAAKALDIDSAYRGAYGELGYAYHLSGKFAEGVKQFKIYIERSHQEMPMYYAGLCYIELKDKEGALSMYDQLTKISSKMADGLKKRIDKMN